MTGSDMFVRKVFHHGLGLMWGKAEKSTPPSVVFSTGTPADGTPAIRQEDQRRWPSRLFKEGRIEGKIGEPQSSSSRVPDPGRPSLSVSGRRGAGRPGQTYQGFFALEVNSLPAGNPWHIWWLLQYSRERCRPKGTMVWEKSKKRNASPMKKN